ncbi:hypothetical protein VW29_20965 [Devosia limi DSM 17137]|uniref:Uncharacterized membrane protein n=2 Tax=Devosia TaxID=46913 RepID=A0A0F5L1H9_9HYPH|nr:hypothetical protein VW29_20965 [Devosia limi DSM 17137]SHF18858.1 Uncharacterized membrane protein [Devosia limi DSM 17137]
MTLRGMRIVIALIIVLGALPGLIFFSLGAWPIIGFMGLDIIAIIWALRVSMNAGKRREQITLWPDRLDITVTDAKGNAVTKRFDPRTLRLQLDRDYDERTTALKLRAGGEETEIGAFLTLDDKSSFGKAFGTALRQARSGRF